MPVVKALPSTPTLWSSEGDRRRSSLGHAQTARGARAGAALHGRVEAGRSGRRGSVARSRDLLAERRDAGGFLNELERAAEVAALGRR
jgi:hypothetical protein